MRAAAEDEVTTTFEEHIQGHGRFESGELRTEAEVTVPVAADRSTRTVVSA